jgi:hypothetical protein
MEGVLVAVALVWPLSCNLKRRGPFFKIKGLGQGRSPRFLILEMSLTDAVYPTQSMR